MVTKADGSRQQFDRNKIVATCMRMGATRNEAEQIAGKIESRVYDGMSTAKVLQMIFQFIRRFKPQANRLYDLRRGLSLMSSKPEFERFVQVLLANVGFDVDPNRVLRGKCIEHEVDAIARKNGVTYFVEAKHHYNYHAYTGLDESRIARALLEDVTEGFNLGLTELKVDKAMIVTNTKYSEQAVQYGACRNILQIGWSTPIDLGLRDIIQARNLYPLSCIKGLKTDARVQLVDSDIILISQLLAEETVEIARRTRLPLELIRNVKSKVESTESPSR
jgi:ATP cone domain/Restriction endonuclease